MKALQQKAAILVEALPYIQRFRGARFVIKYGGHAMVDEQARRGFARDLVLLQSIGIDPIVVHGGGPQISATLGRLGFESRFDPSGLRITDEATMDVVRMVLVGQVNPDIVSLINQCGGRATGLSGVDGGLLCGRRVGRGRGGVDLGRVGTITRVDCEQIDLLCAAGLVPVIAPVAVDAAGRPLNVNADAASGVIARSVGACKLLLMTDVEGVRDEDGRILKTIDRRLASRLVDLGVVGGGMVPKLRCALEALEAGVRKAHIVDGRVAHALLLEIFTDRGVGTEVV